VFQTPVFPQAQIMTLQSNSLTISGSVSVHMGKELTLSSLLCFVLYLSYIKTFYYFSFSKHFMCFEMSFMYAKHV